MKILKKIGSILLSLCCVVIMNQSIIFAQNNSVDQIDQGGTASNTNGSISPKNGIKADATVSKVKEEVDTSKNSKLGETTPSIGSVNDKTRAMVPSKPPIEKNINNKEVVVNPNTSQNGTTTPSVASPKVDTGNKNQNKEATIVDVLVTGDLNKSAKGVDYFKDIKISLVGENLTDDNFLTKEGLHWSDKTFVELIKGSERGIINKTQIFGPENTPKIPVKAYSINPGDQGRINFVGKTKSGIELALYLQI